MYKILVDAYGGDNAPQSVIDGSIEALKQKDNFIISLVGKEEEIKTLLQQKDYDESRIEIINAEEIITCEEEPTIAIRRKTNSTINVAFKTLKEDDDYVGFVSAGSTGALLVGATLKLGRAPMVNRPALCPVIPTIKDGKNVLLLDSGANADCKPINLCQFAVMGSEFSKVLGVKKPKVALLSNGTEDEKGNTLTQNVFHILKKLDCIDFVGNVEARDILSGEVDVIVADGFSGNVALKSVEGAVKTMFKLVNKEIKASLSAKIGALFLRRTLKSLIKKLDYSKKGGAIVLGVKKTVVKAHGSSKAIAITNAILQANAYAKENLSAKVSKVMETVTFPEMI